MDDFLHPQQQYLSAPQPPQGWVAFLKSKLWRRQTLGYILLLLLIEMLALHLSWPRWLQPILMLTQLLDLIVVGAWQGGDFLGWLFQRGAAFLDPYAGIVLRRLGYIPYSFYRGLEQFLGALRTRFEAHQTLRHFVTPAALATLTAFLLVLGVLIFVGVVMAVGWRRSQAAAVGTTTPTTPVSNGGREDKKQK